MSATDFKVWQAVERQILLAVDPLRPALNKGALRRVALGAVAQWASDQDESVPPQKIVEVVRHGVAWVNERFT